MAPATGVPPHPQRVGFTGQPDLASLTLARRPHRRVATATRKVGDGRNMATAADTGPPRSLNADVGLLGTKLARPRVPDSYIARPHVRRLLQAGTRGPLTVVSAGPGWGKTLAAAHWVDSEPGVGPVGWVSLDASDNEPRRFWSYFVAALRASRVVPPDNPLAELVPELGAEEEHSRRLMVGLSLLRVDVVVVLDDFHLIHESAVLSQVAELLRLRLERLHLVLITRSDPVLPLHRLRMSGDLAEVRSQDLAFGIVEASQMLERNGLSVTTDEAQLLIDRTEGWPAGLRLAALFLARQREPRCVADFAGDDQTVVSYLAEEVLGSQPPDVRQFLLRSSVAERLTSGLAEVLTGQSHSQHHLEALESSNAFVVGLGPGRQWFRYHALLREMLQHRLMVDEPSVVPDLHRRAARWFAEHGYPIQALNHAADAEDWSLLGQLFVTYAFPRLLSVDRLACDQALARIPSARLADGPELAMCAAARQFHAGLYEDMQPHLELAADRLNECSPESRAGTQIVRLLLSMSLARTRGDIPGTMKAASVTLDHVAEGGGTFPVAAAARAIALSNLGTGLLWSGQVSAAEECLLVGLAAAETCRIGVAEVNVLSHLGLAAAASDRLDDALGFASRAVELVESRGWTAIPQIASAHLALSMVNLQQNDLTKAQVQLDQGRAASGGDRIPRLALRLAQARMHASVGRVGAAREEMLLLQQEIAQSRLPILLSQWLAITESEIELADGDPIAAAARIGSPAGQEPPFGREQVCLARALMGGGEVGAAEEVLANLRDRSVPVDAHVELWLLTALAADSQRQDNRAMEAIGHALQEAALENTWRPFVTLDPERIIRLLCRLKEANLGSRQLVDRFLEYLHSDSSQRASPRTLAPPLTDRELIVLRFLPTMMTNAEIASELCVSVNTVKAHLKHIFRKLGVDSRRQAVNQARQLNLLSGSQT